MALSLIEVRGMSAAMTAKLRGQGIEDSEPGRDITRGILGALLVGATSRRR
jgi:hypothetical protein